MHAVFAQRLLAWFDRAGRKHLPWQRDPTPYRVWISEVMLQQTQVATVAPYFERFMQRFPNVEALAGAPLDDVLHEWTGLGYYARARNLQRTAQIIVAQHGSKFPLGLEQVQALPGIGRSTAGAILSLACGQRHAILDGNVKRVLTRHHGVAGFPGEKRVEAQLWDLADKLTPHERVGHYTQAIMDLGATLCLRTRPACADCPVQADCVAYRDGLQSTLPTARPKRVRPQRTAFVVVAIDRTGSVLLERRPPSGIWGGLWTFPQFDTEHAAAATWMSGAQTQTQRLPPYRHAFTHFDLTLHPIVVQAPLAERVADSDRYCWYDLERPARIGLAKPVADLIRQAQSLATCEK